MQKILMVCLGNICRSPLAEGIMLKLIKENSINMRVDSAGTSDYHIDEAIVESEIFLQILPQWFFFYNTKQTHFSLGLLSPQQYVVF